MFLFFFSLSLSLSLSLFTSFHLFHLDSPFVSSCNFHHFCLPKNLELWKHDVVGYVFWERKTCVSEPSTERLPNYVLFVVGIFHGLGSPESLAAKYIQPPFPKNGSLLFVHNKRWISKLGALHHWRAYLVHNVVAACQLVKWNKIWTNIEIVATTNRKVQPFLGAISSTIMSIFDLIHNNFVE